LIVDGFEEPEEPDLIPMRLIVEAVADGRDPANHLAVTLGKKVFGFGVFEEGVFAAGEQ
jgi:hypothetical protein